MRMRIEVIGEEAGDGIQETMDETGIEIETIADLTPPNPLPRTLTDTSLGSEVDEAQVTVEPARGDDQARDESSVRGEMRMGTKWWEGDRGRQPRN
jgi:hypothetical protein